MHLYTNHCTKIIYSHKSDFDFGIIAEGVAGEVMKTGIEKYLFFDGTIDRNSVTGRFIIGTYATGDKKDGGSKAKAEAEYQTAKASRSYQYEDGNNSTEPSHAIINEERRLQVQAYPGYTRYYDILGECFGSFWKEWETKFGKPIQFYLAENKYRNPGWEFVFSEE